MENQKNDKIGLIIILTVIACIVYFGQKYYNKDLERNGCYSVARTIGKHFQYRNGMVYDFEYYYNGKRYVDYDSDAKNNVKENGGYYLIEISSKHPDINRIYFDRENDSSNFKIVWGCSNK